MTTEKTYNGWKNRATWNLVLWAENDYELYQWIREKVFTCYWQIMDMCKLIIKLTHHFTA